MYYSDIFNHRSINLFVDGSIYHNKNTLETIGCPGGVICVPGVNGEPIIHDRFFTIRRNSTNNDTEISAIKLGLDVLIEYLGKVDYVPENINIFSDSQICIKGLTEWVFNWTKNIHQHMMYGSSGLVANQEIFKRIFKLIMDEKIHINFYHQKGHVTSTDKSISHAVDVFKKSNNLTFVDRGLIVKLSEFNNYVDIFTKEELDKECILGLYDKSYPKHTNPVYTIIDGFDSKLYKNLTKKSIR